MEIKIEISEEEIKKYVMDYLVRRELDGYSFSKDIRRALKPVLEEISKEFRKELKSEIINRSVEKIVGQDKGDAYKLALASMLKEKK